MSMPRFPSASKARVTCGAAAVQTGTGRRRDGNHRRVQIGWRRAGQIGTAHFHPLLHGSRPNERWIGRSRARQTGTARLFLLPPPRPGSGRRRPSWLGIDAAPEDLHHQGSASWPIQARTNRLRARCHFVQNAQRSSHKASLQLWHMYRKSSGTSCPHVPVSAPHAALLAR